MRERLCVTRDEAVPSARPDLEVDGAGGVIRIVLDHRAVKMVDRIVAPAAVLVGEILAQTVDIAATTLEPEIPSMWSKERFSSINTTMWSTFPRLALLVCSVTTASFAVALAGGRKRLG